MLSCTTQNHNLIAVMAAAFGTHYIVLIYTPPGNTMSYTGGGGTRNQPRLSMLVHGHVPTTPGVQPPHGAAPMAVVQDDFETGVGQPAEQGKMDSARRTEGGQRRSRSPSRSRWRSQSRQRSRGNRHRSRSRSRRRRRRSRYVTIHFLLFHLRSLLLDQHPAQAAQALQAVAAEALGHLLVNPQEWRSANVAAGSGKKRRI